VDVKTRFAALEASQEFSGWKKEHPKSFLAHVFRMIDGAQDNIWQFGFYNENDTMTTFFLNENAVTEEAEEEIFKANAIHELEISSVKLDFDEAVGKVAQLQKKKYEQHTALKTIVVLQVIENKTLYNITFITAHLNTLNVRVDAKTGSVVQEKLTALADMMQEAKPDKPDYVG